MGVKKEITVEIIKYSEVENMQKEHLTIVQQKKKFLEGNL